MTTPLTLETTRRDDSEIVLIAVGEIDQSNIDPFRQALTSAFSEAANGGGTFTVDLTAVEYLDSAAINALYAHADHIRLIADRRLISILKISGIAELATIDLPPTPP